MSDAPDRSTVLAGDAPANPLARDVTTDLKDSSTTPAEPSTGGAPPTPAGYELGDEIGRGGMGIVYRAHDPAVNRDVAVKVLQDRYRKRPRATRRFVEEGQVTGQLQHPGIPAIHQIGILSDGSPFLAMKLIKGDTLADRLAAPDPDRGRMVAVFLRSRRQSATRTPRE